MQNNRNPLLRRRRKKETNKEKQNKKHATLEKKISNGHKDNPKTSEKNKQKPKICLKYTINTQKQFMVLFFFF